MLGKLMKYEFKSTAKWFLPLYAFTLVLALLTRLLTSASVFSEGMLRIIPQAITTLYIFSIIATFILTFFLIVYRFYKSMVTEEGYLTHTLPVSTLSLIFSKLISATLWVIFAGIITLLSIFLLAFDIVDFSYIFEGFETYNKTFQQFDITIFSLFAQAIVLGILGICYYILRVYSAIAMGQLFNKQKLLASFAFYFILGFATQVIYLFSMIVPMFTYNTDPNAPSVVSLFFPIMIAISLVLCAIHFGITQYIFSKKLNLE